MANIIEDRLNTIRNIKNTSGNIKNRTGKQHNKIPNLILAVITPRRRIAFSWISDISIISCCAMSRTSEIQSESPVVNETLAPKILHLWFRTGEWQTCPLWRSSVAFSRISGESSFAIFGFGKWETYPLRLSFAVCRIRGVPFISVLKRRFCLWIVLYPISDKFALTGILIMLRQNLL